MTGMFSPTDQKSENYLGIGILAVLGETGLLKFILIRSLEIKGGNIIKKQSQVTSKQCSCMSDADLLNQLLL